MISFTYVLLAAGIGGFMSALYDFDNKRKDPSHSFDAINFVIVAVTGCFAGLVVFGMTFNFTSDFPKVTLALAALGAVGGYEMIVRFKDTLTTVITKRINPDSLLNTSVAANMSFAGTGQRKEGKKEKETAPMVPADKAPTGTWVDKEGVVRIDRRSR